MQKILTGAQVKELDANHVKITGQSSLKLMESAGQSFVNWFLDQGYSKEKKILIAVGAGNNGGDGLVIARLLVERQYQVRIIDCFGSIDRFSPDALSNFNLLPKSVQVVKLNPDIFKDYAILIDAYLGVGLRGELRESAIDTIQSLNLFQGVKISIDIPAGLPSEGVGNTELCFQANWTVTFEFPKLALLLPENTWIVGELIYAKIKVDAEAFDQMETSYYFLEKKDIPALHKHFTRFSYKGDLGKVLLIGGGPGKMGAIILSCKSAMRTGSGLVTCHIEESERAIIQTAVPEAMASWGLIANPEYYDALGIGPGWGTDNRLRQFQQLLKDFNKPMVIDADGINLLAKHEALLSQVPENSILTPHIGEFERLVGNCQGHLERLSKAKLFAMEHKLIIVLKGANTVVSLPDGKQIFNSSGTQYMATGGSGDVLTGMITSYLGMGYDPVNAALCGVYHHGLAGEIASKSKFRGTIASDIIDAIPETYSQLRIA
ncbi:NAD(P)H-hydrate dehydratase [Algoriphagus halophytocola]|uniref:NAD(P)H-hydrate dehydratase n=1 Tax=Algoriphagus halophytocola TaxID=2991499 RepID=UPI0022DDBB53|nr:NAD(P)H-hydrate dehydratase [Algoriphagus sp. TR-M9]WBL41824.1 NAD(P)H-hydrate dehydratase [Algoriphagus sp. TR-M9]